MKHPVVFVASLAATLSRFHHRGFCAGSMAVPFCAQLEQQFGGFRSLRAGAQWGEQDVKQFAETFLDEWGEVHP